MATAIAQPVSSVVVVLLVAAVSTVSLATAGQTSAAESGALARVDAVGTRTVVFLDTLSAGLDTSSVDRLAALSGVEWAIGFGPTIDVRTLSTADGADPVPLRLIYGETPLLHQTEGREPRPGEVLVSTSSRNRLGLWMSAGTVVSSSETRPVVGTFTAGEPVGWLEAGAVGILTEGSPISRIIVMSSDPTWVAGLTEAGLQVLGAEDAPSVGVETSEDLAALRATLSGDLSRFSRSIVLVIAGAGLLMICLVVYGSVTARRRDFGRRRALGASRTVIVALVVLQVGVASLVGAAVGAAVGALIVHRITGLMPSGGFVAGVSTLAVLSGLTGAFLPAALAARRDPVTILRVA